MYTHLGMRGVFQILNLLESRYRRYRPTLSPTHGLLPASRSTGFCAFSHSGYPQCEARLSAVAPSRQGPEVQQKPFSKTRAPGTGSERKARQKPAHREPSGRGPRPVSCAGSPRHAARFRPPSSPELPRSAAGCGGARAPGALKQRRAPARGALHRRLRPCRPRHLRQAPGPAGACTPAAPLAAPCSILADGEAPRTRHPNPRELLSGPGR